MQRRRFLTNSALLGGGLALPLTTLGQSASSETNELRIPPLLDGTMDQGRRHYALNMQAGNTEFFSGVDTATLGLNGNFLGPTVRLRRDEQVTLSVNNSLDEPSTLHWHGLHVPAAADGGPHQVIPPGTQWDANFKVDQDAGTFWYHSHLEGRTGEQVYRGLAGMMLIEDETSRSLELPSEYGMDDIPLVIQDRNFNADGSFRYTTSRMDSMLGLFGNTVMVNGTVNPHFVPTTRKVRFRILNGSNARTYNLVFSDNREMQQIACDGGFLTSPIAMRRLELAPGERCEIVADFSDGQPVNLISLPIADDSPFRTTGMMGNMHTMNQQRLHIMAIRPQSSLAASPDVPMALGSMPPMEPDSANRLREFTLTMGMGMGGMGRGRGGGGRMGGMGSMFAINGKAMDMNRIDERIPVGSTEIWEIRNESMMMHPFHIHHGQFRIISSNNREWPEHEHAYKDTVKVGPGQRVRILMKFDDFADSELPYMYHCHILEHEDAGMMGQFVVE